MTIIEPTFAGIFLEKLTLPFEAGRNCDRQLTEI